MFESLRVYAKNRGQLIDIVADYRDLRGYAICSAGVDETGLYLVAEPLSNIAYLGNYCVHADGKIFDENGLTKKKPVYKGRTIPRDQFVLMAFGEWINFIKGAWIKHLDGDAKNNALLNLKIMDGGKYDYNKQV